VPLKHRLDMNKGLKLGSRDCPVNVHNWVVTSDLGQLLITSGPVSSYFLMSG
jgi:hypothetical protein